DGDTPEPTQDPTVNPTPTQTPTPTVNPTPTQTPTPTVNPTPTVTTIPTPESELEELVSGNNAFAFDLYSEMQSEDGNLFFSPFSISTALAMTYAGAQGETEKQMSDVLHFTLPQQDLHPTLNALDILLTAKDDQQPIEGKFVLNIANSLWGQKDYPFVPEFLQIILTNYSAGIEFVDYRNDFETARSAINDWVSEQTEEKIKDLIPEGGIDELTRLVLANAIYFYSDWLYPFEASRTHDRPFNLLSGDQVDVPMMNQLAPFRHSSGEGYQAVELRYVGDTAAMTIIVPDSGNFTSFESGLSIDVLQEILANLQQKDVALTMPKFSYDYSLNLAQTLAEMGMPRAFDKGKAEFFGIAKETPEGPLCISGVFHKAFVDVDEKGTEAAAATAVGVSTTFLPHVDVQLTIDRPFIYLIRDVNTGSILFMGRVLSPVQ
ncbi:MAG: serpin family protein, partial [Chloroflexi bacterium]|nr:serpin family protein [Chloroflexota bacterium]